ncbi:site-specific tyrosine recombinase XerD [SAR202 cluster bacterium AD-804-J14_MRT_500m]|nr:site-specific tyrosine recombinase XerD [SAR202 cluster bacterium AD-804-J14_MRT_500m]
MHEPINSFLHHLVVERGFSHNTLEAYRNDLYQLMTYVKGKLPSANGASTWSHIGVELLTEYVFSLRGEKSYRDSTTARKVAAIKSFFNFLVQEGHVDKDPSESLSAPTPGRSLPKFLTEEEVNKLLEVTKTQNTPEGCRDWAILELLYATGLRVTELVSLNVDDANLTDGYVRPLGKGGKERLTYLHQRAIDALQDYLSNARPKLAGSNGADKALFLNRRGERLTRQWIWAVLKASAKRANINKPIAPHILRHTFATHMLKGGAPLRHVQELLGHASITTTQIYTHLTTEHVRQEYEKSHPRS